VKVTVQNPVSADVTPEQAELWLERHGWERRSPTIDSQLYRHRDFLEWVSVPKPGCHRIEKRLAEAIEEASVAMGRTAADVLREMSEVVP